MPVVTITGRIGAGGPEVGIRVAELLEADYIDRLVLAEAAKRIGSTISALTDKEQKVVRLRDRMAHFLQTMLEKSAISGAAGEPYFSPGIETLPGEPYTDLAEEPITEAQRLSDQKFLEVTSGVIRELAHGGNVVIIGRGSNLILKDTPGSLHVALFNSLERCIETIMHREGYTREEAERYVDETDKARESFFRKFFKVHPEDPNLYHLCLNLAHLSTESAASIVAQASKSLTR